MNKLGNICKSGIFFGEFMFPSAGISPEESGGRKKFCMMPTINRHKNVHCAYRLAHEHFDRLRGSRKSLRQRVKFFCFQHDGLKDELITLSQQAIFFTTSDILIELFYNVNISARIHPPLKQRTPLKS